MKKLPRKYPFLSLSMSSYLCPSREKMKYFQFIKWLGGESVSNARYWPGLFSLISKYLEIRTERKRKVQLESTEAKHKPKRTTVWIYVNVVRKNESSEQMLINLNPLDLVLKMKFIREVSIFAFETITSAFLTKFSNYSPQSQFFQTIWIELCWRNWTMRGS